jgi:hypothetical protein
LQLEIKIPGATLRLVHAVRAERVGLAFGFGERPRQQSFNAIGWIVAQLVLTLVVDEIRLLRGRGLINTG